MREIKGVAFAKVNFTLDIGPRRGDGYHPIRSIMQSISLHDDLTISRRPGPSGINLTVTGERAGAAPADSSNLVYCAVKSVLDEAGIDTPAEAIEIELVKRIPSQAGLGGGSSDAATALVLADRLFDLALPSDTLLRLARNLGCDVPFFLTGGTCLVEGLGEQVTPLPHPLTEETGRKFIVLCKPETNVPTPLAYRELDRSREVAGWSAQLWGTGADPTSDWQSTTPNSPLDFILSNDFEPIVLALFPEIARVHETMTNATRDCGASKPLLSGSGSALFCVCDTEDIAVATADALKQAGLPTVEVAHTCPGGVTL